MAGSAGVYVTVDDNTGNIHRQQFPANVRARVWTGPSDHYLMVAVDDSGVWVLTETQPGGRPHIIARGQLPTSRIEDDAYDWHG